MRLLCKQLGGSHSYGLDTPQSDVDYRGIFVNTDMASVIGMNKNEHKTSQSEEKDEAYWEFRNAMKLLRDGNSQVVELLFTDEWVEISPEWLEVQKRRTELVSTDKLYTMLKGYGQSELRLANGERAGKLGGKRQAALEKYGFSPKNFVQLYRLYWAGINYFESGIFPVRIRGDVAKNLLEIKTQPENFTKEQLNAEAAEWEAALHKAYNNRMVVTEFNEELANQLCLKVYAPIVKNLYETNWNHRIG
jgi:predicted nucleotidyltransferase